jgi:hypothetical protein
MQQAGAEMGEAADMLASMPTSYYKCKPSPLNDAVPSPLKDVIDQFNKEQRPRRTSDEYKLFYSKTGRKASESPLEQLTDDSKVSESEKAVISTVQASVRESYTQLQDAQRRYGGAKGVEIANALDRHLVRLDKSYLDLYRGNITWGEFSLHRKEYAQAFQDEVNQIEQRK